MLKQLLVLCKLDFELDFDDGDVDADDDDNDNGEMDADDALAAFNVIDFLK